ncbi:uncharacterized protein JNUCC1_00576 [Lentibacillus sp. JNUCC-1]|uniref:DUF2188 domain-containing protein n=1 Tax=Lentibacillus sp. JNUCC-1 TaxID=2654513 RepID=UPI0012E98FA1|nr:DUF2188 domain-containing protein [Lentibacillus sp. JNUCC-1]MUV36772.1 uncharacterized protein [Lentibacillus sp. JNUCC-1]
MPWDLNDYPSSMKNLNKAARKKAIDIANAMVDEGYDEGRAIPIATKQAKEWYKDASAHEREQYLQQGKPKEHESDDSARPELMDKAEFVEPQNNGEWAVRSKDAKQAAKTFDNKDEAVEYGKNVAQKQGTRLIIYKQDGSKQETFDYTD